MSSRKIEDLTPEMQAMFRHFDDRMDAAGIEYIVTCTKRTRAEQDALYEQGRSKPGRIVTWTRNSRHLKGEAFDIVVMENGKPDWCVSNPKWAQAGEIGLAVGLNWAGRWPTGRREYPHFECKEEGRRI